MVRSGLLSITKPGCVSSVSTVTPSLSSLTRPSSLITFVTVGFSLSFMSDSAELETFIMSQRSRCSYNPALRRCKYCTFGLV